MMIKENSPPNVTVQPTAPPVHANPYPNMLPFMYNGFLPGTSTCPSSSFGGAPPFNFLPSPTSSSANGGQTQLVAPSCLPPSMGGGGAVSAADQAVLFGSLYNSAAAVSALNKDFLLNAHLALASRHPLFGGQGYNPFGAHHGTIPGTNPFGFPASFFNPARLPSTSLSGSCGTAPLPHPSASAHPTTNTTSSSAHQTVSNSSSKISTNSPTTSSTTPSSTTTKSSSGRSTILDVDNLLKK